MELDRPDATAGPRESERRPLHGESAGWRLSRREALKSLLALPVKDWSATPVWRCPFGPSGRPAPGVVFTERVAVAGAGVVAAGAVC